MTGNKKTRKLCPKIIQQIRAGIQITLRLSY